MPLTWDATNCRNWNAIPSGTREALIFFSMTTGLDSNWELGEAYAPEFYARVALYERLHGALTYNKEGETPITIEDVRNAIGLKTNCSPVSRAKFIKNVVVSELNHLAAKFKGEKV